MPQILSKGKFTLTRVDDDYKFNGSNDSMSWLEKLCKCQECGRCHNPNRTSGTQTPFIINLFIYQTIRANAEIARRGLAHAFGRV